jgi:3-hydroxyacyl-CoA dehydrogenase/enoyl-CoA hydratase/carnithine racemase
MIRKIAVLGSGVMGAAIAAHIASSNLKVILLDIVLPQNPDRNYLTKKAVNSIIEKKLLVHENKIKNIEIGNLDDDLQKLANVDLIIEVIIEDLAIKENLYRKITNFIKPTAIIASNTSTIPLEKLTANLPKFLKQNFFITHFFNPPRYMPLLELVYNKDSDTKKLKTLKKFLDKDLGKTVIICNDTPGFIANRIGCYFLEIAMREAIACNISPEEADNITQAFGIPKTGIFGLWDLIGVDLMPLISASIIKELPAFDAYCQDVTAADIITKMIELKLMGRKSGQGFYKLVKTENSKTMLSLDFKTLTYKAVKTDLAKYTLAEILATNEKIHDFAKKIIFKTLAYAASIVPSATSSIYDLDIAMKKGYSWSLGPFELIDKIGINKLTTYLKQNNINIPQIIQKFESQKFYTNDSYLTHSGKYKKIASEYDYIALNTLKNKPIIHANDSGYLVDIGDNVGCLVLTNKLGVLNHSALMLIKQTLACVTQNLTSLVITSSGEHLSAGADLKFIYENIQNNNISNISDYISLGQDVMKSLKAAPFPVVIAHKGMALGGGAELILHADFVCSHIEAQFGLVETTVGLVPGWGGIKEMLLKCVSNKNSEKLLLNLITGYKTNNVATLKQDFLFKNVSIHMNAERLISYAKKKAIFLSKKKNPKNFNKNSLTFNTLKLSQLIDKQSFLEHQYYIANEILNIFKDAIQDFTENKVYDLERKLFLKLAAHPKTQERIAQFLKNGTKLKN